ncbi:hypothetical protein NE237_024916 [Protea cynaroides]|uniref:Uncharacterized protein n=1 Tax=Protea cynaroides TaxID=273540 RepID=A0A9Q0H484_9MAGN|nr:hypothetical protein NE237_024916 [Protea cynaroides]
MSDPSSSKGVSTTTTTIPIEGLSISFIRFIPIRAPPSSDSDVEPTLSGIDDDEDNVVASEGLASEVDDQAEAPKVRVLGVDGKEKESLGDGDSPPTNVLSSVSRGSDGLSETRGVAMESFKMTEEENHKSENGRSSYLVS